MKKLEVDFQELNKKIRDDIKIEFLSSKYKGSNKKYKVKCLICNHIWNVRYTSIINDKTGCPKCGIKKSSESHRLKFDEIEINIILKNRKISFISNQNYINSEYKYLWKCLVCNHIWKSNYRNVINGNHGCPKCGYKRTSDKIRGKNNYNWKGGISRNLYPEIWYTGKIQKEIRNRDDHKCQYPDCDYDDRMNNKEALHVHHINADKQNCEDYNLISLCNRHHSKIQPVYKNWMNYFYEYTMTK